MTRRGGHWFDHFGLIAPIYEKVIQPADISQLQRLGDLRASDLVLDVGGGTGRVARRLAPLVARVVVLDLSAGMLREAAAKSHLIPCLGAAEALPFEDGTFTKIIAVDSFHHFTHHQRAAREMIRVLAPGGRLVIEEPDIRLFSVKLVALAERLALMRSHFWRPEALIAMLSSRNLYVHLEAKPPNFWIVVEKATTG